MIISKFPLTPMGVLALSVWIWTLYCCAKLMLSSISSFLGNLLWRSSSIISKLCWALLEKTCKCYKCSFTNFWAGMSIEIETGTELGNDNYRISIHVNGGSCFQCLPFRFWPKGKASFSLSLAPISLFPVYW